MKILFALCVTAFAGLLIACFPPPAHDEKMWLMFFMKGDGKTEDPDALKGHLGNMQKQASLGRLFAAGPLRDPTGERRGITVVAAHDETELKSFFKDDPFVKAGVMTVAAYLWKVDKAKFDPAVKPTDLAEFRLVLIRRGKGMQPETSEMQRAHRDVLDDVAKRFGPAVWGEVEGLSKTRQAMILATKDDDAINAAFKGDPLVSKAIVDVEIVPLFMSKGVIKS